MADTEEDSIFCIDTPSESFTWEPYIESEQLQQDEIIVKGELQEIMPGKTLAPIKHYEATYESLIEFSVSLIDKRVRIG